MSYTANPSPPAEAPQSAPKKSIFARLSQHIEAAHLLAWALVALYTVTFSYIAITRYASFNANAFDLGLFDQSVWNTLHGRIFFYTTTGQPLSHLSNHADFILLLLAPFYLIHSGPETLLVLQAAVIGLGGLPLFWFGRQYLESNFLGLSLLSAYLLFPGLELVTLRDFHPPGLATGFLMFAFYFLIQEKSGRFLVFATLAMACKEQIPLLVAFMGLYALVIQRKWWLGLLTIAYGTIWFFVVMYIVIPAHSVVGESLFLGYYGYLGDSPSDIILGVFLRPGVVLESLWQPAKLRYLFNLLMPFAFLPLLGLPALLIGTPSFAINMLSTNTAMHSTTVSHYVADVAPWIAWGAAFGLFYLRSALSHWQVDWKQPAMYLAGGALLVSAVGFHWLNGYSPLARYPEVWEITAHDRLAERFLSQIPPEAPISAQGTQYPHLSQRIIAYQFPDIHEAEYIFLDVSSSTWPMHPNDYQREILRLLDEGQFGILDAADGYLLLQRGLPNTTLPPEFYTFAHAENPQPEYPADIVFDERLRFLGFDVLDNPRTAESSLKLYWQAIGPIEADETLRLYPLIFNPAGELIETTEQRPMATQIWYPPAQWPLEQPIVAQTLPWPLGEDWSLGLAVLRGEEPRWQAWEDRLPVSALSPDSGRLLDGGTWVRVANFTREGNQLQRVETLSSETQIPAGNEMAVNFDDKISLFGYRTEPVDNSLAVTLFWQAQSEMQRDYTVFVHLIDGAGNIVAQHDATPWWQAPIPTSSWRLGEQVRDQHLLELPAELPPGEYSLRLGLYYWETLERLPVLENGQAIGDSLEIGGLQVE